MKKHKKKMIAPIVITILVLIYYVTFIAMAIYFKLPVIVCVIAILVPLALCGVMVAVCIQRIKEIRSGEEDDLSKY